MTRIAVAAAERLLDPGHFGHVVAQQVLDAGLQGGRGRRAARAGAAHVQPDDAGVGLEAGEQDIAAVLRHRRADAGVDQVLDLGDHLGGLALVDLLVGRASLALDQRRAGGEVVHDLGQDRRLQVRPVAGRGPW